jgi:hypothetical protein
LAACSDAPDLFTGSDFSLPQPETHFVKKTVLLACAWAALALTACGKKPDTGLPQACQDYLDTVSACVAKMDNGAASDAMQKMMDQTKEAWSKIDADKKDRLEAACKQAQEAIKPQLAAMKCD